MPTSAIVRRPGPAFVRAISTAGLGKPDWQEALVQHEAYCAALEACGLRVTVLDTEPGFPDCPFVEDTAVITQRGAVIANPGAPSRNGEQESIRAVLEQLMPIAVIRPPGTLDGGDVLRIDDRFVIGLSTRTNLEGAAQLLEQLKRWGYTATSLPVSGYLHLKSAVNSIGRGNILVTRALAEAECLGSAGRIVVCDGEEHAANSIYLGGTLLMPAGFPRTRDKLRTVGYEIRELEVSEFRKADGGLTCLSLIF